MGYGWESGTESGLGGGCTKGTSPTLCCVIKILSQVQFANGTSFFMWPPGCLMFSAKLKLQEL